MTEEEKIDRAKKYLSQVIDQMALASSDLKRIIKKNVDDIIENSIDYSYLGNVFQFSANKKLEEAVKKILNKLEKDLFNIIYTRCENAETIAYNKEQKEKSDDNVLALFLASEIADKTLDQRINEYVLNMRGEIEAFVAAGIFKKMNRAEILETYIANLQKPFAAPLLFDIFKESGFSAERIASKGISFGTGKYISSFNNLKRLEQDTIFKAYSHINQTIWGFDSDYIGWYTIRGSTYQCGICDSEIGVFHSKTESFGGYHTRCCCLQIPVYKGDLSR